MVAEVEILKSADSLRKFGVMETQSGLVTTLHYAPVLVEAVVDPFTPPMPAKVTLDRSAAEISGKPNLLY
jgi:hypothetical protein